MRMRTRKMFGVRAGQVVLMTMQDGSLLMAITIAPTAMASKTALERGHPAAV
jgi:hypothetical protein